MRPNSDATDPPELVSMTEKEWQLQAIRLFGQDFLNWAFVCPVCANVQSVQDFKNIGEPHVMAHSVYQECIGRHIAGSKEAFSDDSRSGPCNYAGYGLFDLRPIQIVMGDGSTQKVFAFASPPSELDQIDSRPMEY